VTHRRRSCPAFCAILLALFLPASGPAQTLHTKAGDASSHATSHSSEVCAGCIRAHMEFLASDAMQGRGSATHDELLAATYVASQLRQYGIDPAGDDGSYVQRAPVIRQELTAAPHLMITAPGGELQPITWIHGREFLAVYLTQAEFSGPLQKVDSKTGIAVVKPGAVVLVVGNDPGESRQLAFQASSAGAVAALMPLSKQQREHFAESGQELPRLPDRLEGGQPSDLGGNFNVLQLTDDALHLLAQMQEGAVLHFHAPVTDEKKFTWNAVGVLRGRDSSLLHDAILFSAHLDHLGIGAPVSGDNIYNGADDDASGTTAVLELARVLGHGPRPRRTVIFALFGSEEAGGLGSTFFREHPPVPLKDLAANLEFEMIGRPDPAVDRDTLWLSGWERSDFGPELAAHGARLVADPHPAQNFFERSDNYVLAKKGVVAQTISSYGLHQDYHQPSDDLAHIDFKHMDVAIGSLLKAIAWLVNSDFRPKWKDGGKP
jgi:Peptidase family M28